MEGQAVGVAVEMGLQLQRSAYVAVLASGMRASSFILVVYPKLN